MANALWISAIGMGLVFVAILLLWGLMALLVRLTAEKPAVLAEPLETTLDDQPAGVPETDGNAGRALRQRAAAAGIAVALAMQDHLASATGRQPSANLSAWQVVQRAGQLSLRNGAQRRVKQ